MRFLCVCNPIQLKNPNCAPLKLHLGFKNSSFIYHAISTCAKYETHCALVLHDGVVTL